MKPAARSWASPHAIGLSDPRNHSLKYHEVSSTILLRQGTGSSLLIAVGGNTKVGNQLFCSHPTRLVHLLPQGKLVCCPGQLQGPLPVSCSWYGAGLALLLLWHKEAISLPCHRKQRQKEEVISSSPTLLGSKWGKSSRFLLKKNPPPFFQIVIKLKLHQTSLQGIYLAIILWPLFLKIILSRYVWRSIQA